MDNKFSCNGKAIPNSTSMYTNFTIKSDRTGEEYTYNLYEIAGFYAYDILDYWYSLFTPKIKTEKGEWDFNRKQVSSREFYEKLTSFIKLDKNGEEIEITNNNINQFIPFDIRQKVYDELLEVNFGFLAIGENSPFSILLATLK